MEENAKPGPDYKAEITGPYPDGFYTYRIEYFELAAMGDSQESWDEITENWTDTLPRHAKTREKAENLARQQIERWRAIDAAKNNKTEVR